MNHNEAEARAKELTEILEKANYEYYVLDNPTLTDAEFDRYMNELILIEKEWPDLKKKTSPTQRVGGQVVSEFKKIPHQRMMLSLGNVYNEDEVRHFDETIRAEINQAQVDYMEIGRAHV